MLFQTSERCQKGVKKIELCEPTIARAVPAKTIWRWDSFSAMNAPRSGAKIAYVTLNTQTPCPPRDAVPVNTRAWFRESISTQHARFAFGYGCDYPSYVALFIQSAGREVNDIPLACRHRTETRANLPLMMFENMAVIFPCPFGAGALAPALTHQ